MCEVGDDVLGIVVEVVLPGVFMNLQLLLGLVSLDGGDQVASEGIKLFHEFLDEGRGGLHRSLRVEGHGNLWEVPLELNLSGFE